MKTLSKVLHQSQKVDDELSSDEDLLLEAVKNKSWDLVEDLLQNPNFQAIANIEQNYVAYKVARAEQWSLFKLMLNLPVVAKTIYKDDSELLWYCAFKGQLDIVENLLANQHVLANDNGNLYYEFRVSCEIGRFDIFRKIITAKFARLEESGYTPLMIALIHDQFPLVKAMITERSQPVNAISKIGLNALMLAVIKYQESLADSYVQLQCKQIIILLIKSGTNILQKNFYNMSFLSLAAEAGCLEDETILGLILEQISSMNPELLCGKTMFHILCEYGVPICDTLYNFFKLRGTIDLNALDNYGNSAASYLLLNNTPNLRTKDIQYLLTKRVQFVRNHCKIRSPLQFKVFLSPDSDAIHRFLTLDLLQINFQDEAGMTALHYACIQNKSNLAKFLIRNGATYLPDSYRRTPVHYAAINGFVLGMNDNGNYFRNDLSGIPAMIYGLQRAKNIIELQKFVSLYNSKSAVHLSNTTIDKIMQDIRSNSEGFQSNLALLAALKNYCKNILPNQSKVSFAALAAEIIKQEFSKSKYQRTNFMPDFALGIELEISGLTEATFIPLADLISWFNVNQVEDLSVKRGAFDLLRDDTKPEELEFTSEIIDSPAKYHKFLAVCQAFADSGATVNPSCGAHIHVNLRGSNDVAPILGRFVPEQLEFTYIKYVLINYMHTEQLLRGILRDGLFFDKVDGATYLVPISLNYDKIALATDLETLLELCDHATTLDLQLSNHGTIEFRAHEGIIDPTLLNAWVDFVTRLVTISRKQALAHSSDTVYQPYADIEQLVYLLICMRDYPKTWDPRWGATRTSISPSAGHYAQTSHTAQEEIIQAPLYRLVKLFLRYDSIQFDSSEAELNHILYEIKSTFDQSAANEQGTLYNELHKLITFAWANPGICNYNVSLDIIQQLLQSLCNPDISKRARRSMGM